MAEMDAVEYIIRFLGDDVLPVKTVFTEMLEAPFEARAGRCRNVAEMEEFLRDHSDYFIVENRRVGCWDSEFESGRTKALDYFKDELNLYDDPPNYFNFRGHIGQADDDVVDFINYFYPGREFRNFLSAHPDVFVVYEDDSVCLIENESVDYFEECLEIFGEGLFFESVRGHVGQAPEPVMGFINRRYPGKRFLNFLEENSDVFDVRNGYVYLVPDE